MLYWKKREEETCGLCGSQFDGQKRCGTREAARAHFADYLIALGLFLAHELGFLLILFPSRYMSVGLHNTFLASA